MSEQWTRIPVLGRSISWLQAGRTDRGTSEVLSFVLVFALVVSTVVMVYAFGYPALLHMQDVERDANAERSMTTLADAMTDITVHGVPSRATEVKLSDAALVFDEPVTVTVRDETGVVIESRTFQPLAYEGADGTRIVYVGGAVFREQPDGFVVVHEPQLVVSGPETVVLIPATSSATSTQSLGGETDVLVRLERVGSSTVTTDGDVTVEVDSPYADAWFTYLQAQPGATACQQVGSVATCTFDSARSSVTVTDVDVELE